MDRVWMMAVVPVACAVAATAQEPPEVRQFVTFKLKAGQSAEAERIYLESLVPIYTEAPAVRRFRLLREAESPEPLDLVVVTSLRGLAGMDDLNAQLRSRPATAGPGIGALYGRLSALSEFHHDVFVEMVPTLAGVKAAPRLWVFEWVRTVAGRRERYLERLATTLVAWERTRDALKATETARVLVGDGWDVLHLRGFDTLGDFHEHLRAMRDQPFAQGLEDDIAARKTQVLRPDDRFSIR